MHIRIIKREGYFIIRHQVKWNRAPVETVDKANPFMMCVQCIDIEFTRSSIYVPSDQAILIEYGGQLSSRF